MSKPADRHGYLEYEPRDDTLACLGSLAQSTCPNLGIIVLDNASTDGSAEAIQANFPSVQILGLTENLGYAGNNNKGIKLAFRTECRLGVCPERRYVGRARLFDAPERNRAKRSEYRRDWADGLYLR